MENTINQPIILVYGGNGWIGKYIVELLKLQKILVYVSSVRVNNIEDVETEIKLIKPTHIISTIGRTHGKYNNRYYNTIDYLENKGMIYDNIRDNLFSPMVLACIAQKYNIHLTYLGTGCIFEYNETHLLNDSMTGFTEEDKPNFFGSSYSIVKGFTDQLMHLYSNNVLNVRIRMPIMDGKNPRDFIAKIINYTKICDVPNSMSVLPTLLPILIDMILKKKTGTINLVNPGLISHNEILNMYKTHIDSTHIWENFSIEQQNNILMSKRSNNCLSTIKLNSLYPDVIDIKTAILNVILNMKLT